MSRNPSLKLADTVRTVIAYKRGYVNQVRGDTNPQVVAQRIKAEAEANALEAVLEAMHGDYVQLNIMKGFS